LQIPDANLSLKLSAGETTILVGANGSGKTRLASWLEEQAGVNAHRVSAHRALTLNPSVVKVSEKQSRFRLLSGIDTPSTEDYPEQNIPTYRQNHRWHSNSSTHLLNDFDALLQWLFAEQNNIAVCELNARYQGAIGEPVSTKFKHLAAMWERVLPTKRLVITADDIQVEPVGAPTATRYSAAQMSDGERAIFYMIGQVLFAPPGVIIFDEPELHVHRAVLGRLWDELEGSRPDCAFVLITHDLEFAATRSGRKLVIRSFSPPASWTVEEVPDDTGFDEQLTTLILGSRRPILFVEGEGGSLDLAIYRACYPDMTVVARGGCQQVIRSVRSMRANASLTRVTCAGLLDADSRTEADLASLAADNISVLPVSEVENLLLLPRVASAILDHDSHDEADKAVRLSKLKAELFAEAAKPDVQTAIVVGYCRKRIDRALKIVSFEDVKGEAELGLQLMARVATIDVAAFAEEVRDAIIKAIADDDLDALLRIYDRKKHIINTAARYLRGGHKDIFVGWVMRAIRTRNDPNYGMRSNPWCPRLTLLDRPAQGLPLPRAGPPPQR
jgi:ABC-type cobalamin/Fe3+-siderophores transport system ATPase subunit